MKLFNEQFRDILKLYPNDANCRSALRFLEGTDKVSDKEWTEERVKNFLKGLRLEIKKRNSYFGYLIDKINIIVVKPNSKFQTMAVDKDHNLYINPEFTKRLVNGSEPAIWDDEVQQANATDPTLQEFNALPLGNKLFLGIIAHELMHIFKDHVARGHNKRVVINWNGQQVALWNIATDIEINDELIYKWGYYMIKNGIITNPDGTYEFNGVTISCRNKTPERIYRELLATMPPNPDGDGDGDGEPEDEVIEVGDIIFDDTSGRYGEVVTIDANGNMKTVELPRKEAIKKAKERGQ